MDNQDADGGNSDDVRAANMSTTSVAYAACVAYAVFANQNGRN